MSRSQLTIGLVATGLGLVAFAAPASAQSSNPPVIGVSYADLDLGTPSGAATLNRRIGAAANSLCARHRVGQGYWGPHSFRDCVRIALASARPQIEQAMAQANGLQLARRVPITVSGR